MPDDPRVEGLLRELLDSGGTPEEICVASPELLPRVSIRWRRLRAVEDEIGALFPVTTPADGVTPLAPRISDLPHIRGYDVQEVLGRGGMGVVYRARHLRLNRTVALKMLVAGAYAGPRELERFLREAEAVAGLHHPHIVQVHDVGDLNGRPYFTMEYVEGGTLAQKIAGRPQPAGKAAALVAVLAGAVHAAHQGGIVHRDLKPANILLTADGTPKISDFGLARRLEDTGELTQSGAPLGTPSYMAPEQAEGKRQAIGPGTDVYALGAILYELLTGRPPFRADTARETERQVIAQDPVPPSRLHSHVPRDLDTICLKCLQKEPSRRYASALALAEDLDRFGRGEPIAARPMGPTERGLRWLRRRPALATALAAGVLGALASAAVGLWWHGLRSEAVRAAVAAAEDDLREAAGLQHRRDFVGADDRLRRARQRLGDDGPAELHRRLARASGILEVVRRLDAIHLRRALVLTVVKRPIIPRRPVDGPPPASEYEATFREAGLGTVRDDPAAVAARAATSPVRAELIAALDDWAGCDVDPDRRAWILAVLRLVDPDPWRDKIRAPVTWEDPALLTELARAVPVAEQPPEPLAALLRRMCEGPHENDALDLGRRVLLAHPDNFWATVEMAYLADVWYPAESLGYCRAALAIRPETPAVHGAIGVLDFGAGKMSEARHHFEHARDRAPSEPWIHNNLGMIALAAGCRAEAAAHIRAALRLDPDYASAHCNLALILEAEGRRAEALEEAREAIRLAPKDCAAKPDLEGLMMRLGRGGEWRRVWHQELETNPPDPQAWSEYAALCVFLGEDAEYRRTRRDMLNRFGSATDPDAAMRTGRACLLLPGSGDELRQAAQLIDRAVAPETAIPARSLHQFLHSKALVEYRLGRFDSAITLLEGPAAAAGPSTRLLVAMGQYRSGQKDRARKTLAEAVLANDWSAAKADDRATWYPHIFRREAEALILPQWPKFLEGKYQPRDNDERLALLGVCQFRDLRAAEAGLLEAAFADDPSLAAGLSMALRHRAARAAAVAGRGGGADGARLGQAERAHWRRRAREWLRADLDDWPNASDINAAAGPAEVASALASWRADPDLAGVRDPQALDTLPEAERRECLAIWSDLTARIERFLHRGGFSPLPLEHVATIVTTRGMFYDENARSERLVFDDWSPKRFEGVPFRLIDPRGDQVPNAILLHGPSGKFPPRMPRSVRIPCHAAARAIHLLSGVSGWGYPSLASGSVSMIVRLHYRGGSAEDHPLKNGEHFADYVRRVDVPGSKFAFPLRDQQLRYLAVFPRRADRIEEIELIKGPDDTAPIVMAITVEGR